MKKKAVAALLAAVVLICAFAPFGAGAVGLGYTPTEQYAASKYFQRLKAITLTGDMGFDLLNVAASQVGYHEGDSYSETGGENMRGTGNYSEFGYWFGREVMGYENGLASAWCAFFISWCARRAEVPQSVVCNAAYAKPDGAASRGAGYFHVDEISPTGYLPKPGDLIFFDWDCDVTWDHVGLVCYVEGGRVGTVEGNANDGALIREYMLSDPQIRAYGSPNYGAVSEAHAKLIKAKALAQRAAYVSAENIRGFLFPARQEEGSDQGK